MQQTISVTKDDGRSLVNYTLRSSGTNSAEYVDQSSTPSAPRLVKLSHALKPIGSTGSDRHSVLVQHVVINNEGKPVIISDSRTITIPRSTSVTNTLIKDVLAASDGVMNLAGFKDALISGVIL